MADDVPMFPLGSVLLPSVYLPLHVFEPRYQALVQACLEGTPEFGVCLIERGSEVGGGDRRFDVGCMARIIEAVPFDDGRFAIAAVGVRRIKVERWLPDAPYPRAEVVDWDDPPPGEDAVSLREPLLRSLRKVLAMAVELGDDVGGLATEIDDDPVLAGYQIGALAPLGPMDRLEILAAPSPDERARKLVELLDDEALVLARRMAEE